MHEESRFVRDSGSLSATVVVCSKEEETIKVIGLTYVIA